jgi:endonuclease YncB( thermonuclease family)
MNLPGKTLAGVVLILTFLFQSTTVSAWTGKVVRISDGDTIKVLRGRKQVKIRLHGIDTPEKRQTFGNKAKKFTSKMVAGKTVDVHKTDTDRYGRTVAIITVDGKNLNESLVASGFAWVYRKYCKQSYCEEWLQLEAKARENKLGLWRDPHAVAPWEWRHRGEDRGVGQTGFHGNTSSHVFHKPGCKYYNCRNCTVVFKTRNAAVDAGFRSCGMCKP